MLSELKRSFIRGAHWLASPTASSGDTDLKKGGAKIIHNHDHRIVMSFYLANLICQKSNKIDDKSSVKTSYPSFFKHITNHTH